MANRSCLTGSTAAFDVSNDIVFIYRIGKVQRLPNDELKRLETEVLFHIATVDRDLTITGNQTNASDRGLSATRAIIAD